jgi:hypothetical protein
MGVLWLAGSASSTRSIAFPAQETKVPVTFTGGHDYGKNDFGRPVVLIAAALDVKPEIFREAFGGVTPAKGGKPSKEQTEKNKSALMKVLAPHGVTNERLDEVSNYYRFKPESGKIWPTTPAKAYAIVDGGKINEVVVTEPGSGYSSPPTAKLEGFQGFELKVKLALGKELRKNGGVASIEVVPTK